MADHPTTLSQKVDLSRKILGCWDVWVVFFKRLSWRVVAKWRCSLPLMSGVRKEDIGRTVGERPGVSWNRLNICMHIHIRIMISVASHFIRLYISTNYWEREPKREWLRYCDNCRFHDGCRQCAFCIHFPSVQEISKLLLPEERSGDPVVQGQWESPFFWDVDSKCSCKEPSYRLPGLGDDGCLRDWLAEEFFSASALICSICMTVLWWRSSQICW